MSPLPRPPACSGCPSEHDVPGHFVPIDRDEGQPLDIWGERPGETEAFKGEGFVGKSGLKLRWAARAAGVPAFRARNVMLCFEGGNNFADEPTAAECLRRHQPEALTAPPSRPTLLAGANATLSLTGFALPPLEVRGSVVPLLGGGWAITTIHPALLLYINDADPTKKGQPELEPCLAMDVRRALKHCAPRVPTVEVVSPAFVQQNLKDGALLAIDIEGAAPKPSIVGFAPSRDVAWVVVWDEDCPALLEEAMRRSLAIFHNAHYEMTEFYEMGIEMPSRWIDTINLAALADAGLKKRLGVQVLTWVPGTTAWKGLTTHGDKTPKIQPTLRRLWTELLTRLGRFVPQTDFEWLVWYNGLDTAWDFGLAEELRRQIGQRWVYYKELMGPLQRPLEELGRKGIPYSPERMAHHQRACARLVRMAEGILSKVTAPVHDAAVSRAQCLVDELVEVKRLEASKKFSRGEELSKARGRLRAALAAQAEGFNCKSPPQRAALLFDHFGLPSMGSTDEKAVNRLIRRLTKKDEDDELAPTLKPKKPHTVEEVARACVAMRAAGIWKTWQSNYDPGRAMIPGSEGKHPRIRCAYAQHKASTGRIASGADEDDALDKGTKKKGLEFHAQNVPKALRDAFVADPGFVMLGADWKAIQFALAMWDAAKLSGPNGLHMRLLEQQQAGTFDAHTHLASFAYRVEYGAVQAWQRQIAKGYTFGRLFMGGPVGLALEVGHTVSVGRKVCAAHDKAFQLQEWWNWTLAQCKKKRYVDTPLGWRRPFWEWKPRPNEILATRIQSLEADLLKWVFLRIDEDHPEWFEPLTVTHDNIMGQCPTEKVEEGKEYLKSKMEMPVPWLDNRTWKSSIKVGPNWRSVS